MGEGVSNCRREWEHSKEVGVRANKGLTSRALQRQKIDTSPKPPYEIPTHGRGTHVLSLYPSVESSSHSAR
jgi:hypothetical protein